jgi:hypothetical protein
MRIIMRTPIMRFLPLSLIAVATIVTATPGLAQQEQDPCPTCPPALEEGISPTSNNAPLELISISVDDTTGTGNGNGVAEPGETGIRVVATLRNTGTVAVTVTAQLRKRANTVAVLGRCAEFGVIPAGGSATASWRVVLFAEHPCGATADFRIRAFANFSGDRQRKEIETSIPTGNASVCAPPQPGVLYLKVDDLVTSGEYPVNLGGFNQEIEDDGRGRRIENTEEERLELEVFPTSTPRTRVFGWMEGDDRDLPYSAVGPNKVVRARFHLHNDSSTYGASNTNLVPNLRLRLGIRFVNNAICEIGHNPGQGDPGSAPLAREFRPVFGDRCNKTVYHVDLDPIDVPALANDPSQGIQRALEVFAPAPDFGYVSGRIVMSDSYIGVYPRPDVDDAPVKVYGSGGSTGASDFDNPSVLARRLSLNRSVLLGGGVAPLVENDPAIVVDRTPEGVTVNTSALGSDRIGLVAVDFTEGTQEDRANPSGRVRVEPGKLYVASYRVSSEGQSSNHPYLRFRARTAKFQWTYTLEVGGGKAVGSAQGRTLAQQMLPGTGSLHNESDGSGNWYRLYLPTPLDQRLRPEDDRARIEDRMPTFMSEPPPGNPNPSRRDLKVGFDIVDSLSATTGHESEAAINTRLNRIEIRRYNQPLE